MIQVGVVYHSVCGSIKVLAEAIVEGADSISDQQRVLSKNRDPGIG